MRKHEHVAAKQGGGSDAPSFDVGFLVEIAGASLPEFITLRFGGDGRAAMAARQPAGDAPHHPDYDAIARDGRCRMILTTPGLFQSGWRPDRLGSRQRGVAVRPAWGLRSHRVRRRSPR